MQLFRMKRGALATLFITATFFFALEQAAIAQVPPVGPSGPVGPVIRPPQPSPSPMIVDPAPDDTSEPEDLKPTPEELEAQRRADYRQQMKQHHDAALAHDRLGSPELATFYFEEALKWCEVKVDCEQIRRDLARTKASIEQKEAEQQQRQLDASKRTISNVIDDLQTDLAGKPADSTTSQNDLAFIDPNDNREASVDDSAIDKGGSGLTGSGERLFSKGSPHSAPVVAFDSPGHNRLAVNESAATENAEQATVDQEQLVDAAKGVVPQGNPRTKVFLDALEVGKNDWVASYQYLQEARKKYPNDLAIRDAKNFFEGMTKELEEIRPLFMEEVTQKALEVNFLGDPDGREQVEQDYETWSLIQRAQSYVFKEKDETSDFEASLRLLAQAQERLPDNLWIRDLANFIEGSLYAHQMGFTTTAEQ